MERNMLYRLRNHANVLWHVNPLIYREEGAGYFILKPESRRTEKYVWTPTATPPTLQHSRTADPSSPMNTFPGAFPGHSTFNPLGLTIQSSQRLVLSLLGTLPLDLAFTQSGLCCPVARHSFRQIILLLQLWLIGRG